MSNNQNSFEQGWELIHKNIPTPLVSLGEMFGNEIYLKLDYLTHPLISGNKWRKLKHNLLWAHQNKIKSLITFGGAFSNHLIATAAAGNEFGFETIGLVRGEELNPSSNLTLKTCHDLGMKLKFVSREEYKKKNDLNYQDFLHSQYANAFIIPEGGTNEFALEGVKELMSEIDFMPDYVCCSVGTGGTLLGLCKAFPKAKVLGFLALKAENFENEIEKLANYTKTSLPLNFKLTCEYHFGGYGKFNEEILSFIRGFMYPLDKVYTAKLLLGVMNELKKGTFHKGNKIVVYHSGGLQGN
ncbi:MAG: pyridoxal-phosphate dependent enzyme [Cytophagales bacterium]